MNARPPIVIRALARLLVGQHHREFVLGDLEELFEKRAARHGRAVASIRYLTDVAGSAWASLLARAGHRRRAGWAGRAALPGSPRHRPDRGFAALAGVRLPVRSLIRDPGFTVLAVLTLALGIGCSAAVFGMIDQLLLRPIPGTREGHEAAYLQFRSIEEPERTQGRGIATLDFDELRRSATLLTGIASFGNVRLKVMVGDGRPLPALGNTVYGDFFETLRAWPAAGRLLSASETELGADPLKAVLGEELAVRLFGSAEAAVGRSVRMNDHRVTVLGVAGGGFGGPERGVHTDVWLPYGALVPLVDFTDDRLVDRESVMHGDIIARAAPGTSSEAALAQVEQILDRLAQANNASGPYLADLRPRWFPGLTTPPLVRATTNASLRRLAIVVGLVLLLTCANLANLLLFRNVRRRGAVATLRALGASRAQIASQQLISSLLIGLLGGVCGVAVGWIVALPFRGAELMRMPAFEGLVLDARVLLFAVAAGFVTAVLFGPIPALLAGRFDLAGSLRSASTRDTGRMVRLRSALAALQLSLGLALVVGALLIVRSVRNLYSVDLGLDTDGVVAITVDPSAQVADGEANPFYRQLLDAIGSMPEVRAVAGDPYGPYGPTFVGRMGLPEAGADDRLRVKMLPVTPGWFELFRVPFATGAPFGSADWQSSTPRPVIFTESLALRMFGTTAVVGRAVEGGFGTRPEPMEIVGVVRDIRSPHAPDRPEDTFFVTPDALPRPLPFFTILARVQPFNPEVARRLRAIAETELPDEPVPDPERVSARLDDIHAEARVYGRLLGLLAAVAVLLSAIGLYGVVAFTVASRRREFGVRIALGAETGRIAQLVGWNAAGIVGTGTVLGLASAYAVSALLQSRLYGVKPLDPTTYAAAAAILVFAAAAACWTPTRRAVRVDPADTLRED